MLTLGCERVRFRQVGSTFTPLKTKTKTRGLFCFLYPFFGGSVAGFMRLWLVFCFGGGFSSGYVQSLGGGEMGGVAGVRWLRSSSKCAHVLQPEMVVSEAHHLSRSRWPLSLARIKVALLLSLGFFCISACVFCVSLLFSSTLRSKSKKEKQEANEKIFF